jgi:coenzyme F420-dependent glucose-6-phosphate dehydrogenase
MGDWTSNKLKKIMIKLGYALSSEEFTPSQLIRYAQEAERSGFAFSLISDHFHPWINRQNNSPFVWSVLGALAQSTNKIPFGTAVTCPTFRIHPLIVAQAAATAAVMMPGRFFLGVGSGEYLNEHITGSDWPRPAIRLDMLEEAVHLIRTVWQGSWQNFDGNYYTVKDARLFTLPDTPPPIMVAGSKPRAAELAGRIGDGLIGTVPKRELVQKFEKAGGAGKPRYGQMTVCYAESENAAAQIVREQWPNGGMGGSLTADLPTPAHFEAVAEVMAGDKMTEDIILGPSAEKHIEGIQKYIDAGFDHVYVHQIGPDQSAFINFYTKRILPELSQY